MKRMLLTDDIALDDERFKRSRAVSDCVDALARKLGAPIDRVHVDEVAPYVLEYSPEQRPALERYLARKREMFRKKGRFLHASDRAIFISGDPVPELVSLSRKRNQYELVALSSHGRKGLGRIVMGSVSEEMIRRSPIPVLTIGPKAQAGAGRFLKKAGPTIFVPTGLTPNTDRAESYAVSLAKRLGGKIVLFHSTRESLHPVLQTAFAGPSAAIRLEGLLAEIGNRALKLLQKRASRLKRLGISVSVVVENRSLSASEAILKEARKKSASMIVMGTHGRSLVAGAFLGRTARDVLLGSPVPVITVRSKRS